MRLANSYFQTAANLSPDDPQVHTRWGDLFLEKFNEAEARSSYETALKADAQYVPALVGMARALADSNPTAAEAAARQAIAIDPDQPDAWVLLASEAMDASKRADARAALEKVLAVNPRHVEALALSAALAQIEDRPADVDALLAAGAGAQRAQRRTCRASSASAWPGMYRFDEAVRFLREAVALDPENSRAQASLGLHLLRTGDEAEARKALDAAFAKDSFDTVTYNLLSLMDTLDKFVTVPGKNLTHSPARAGSRRAAAVPRAAGRAGARRSVRRGISSRRPARSSSRSSRATTTSPCARWACPGCSARSAPASAGS